MKPLYMVLVEFVFIGSIFNWVVVLYMLY